MAKKPSHSRKLNVYSNLSHRLRTKKDAQVRKRAQYLATLPKHPLKRLLYRMQPKRLAAFWFSKQGAIMALKVAGVAILLLALMVGGLFAYFRKDLDAIRPGEISKRVQTTVSKYYDRNGVLLWEDKGDGNYKLVVKSEDLSPYLKKATVAIEDKEFYSHNGVSLPGLVRAVVNNAGGGNAQGGSTLTQQLVKQVFFADEAQNRGLSGIPRKIKELILSVEVERMYDKDQILTLYLNESPYGGRRNGAESGAQTYFGKSAKDLTLPEAALLASIPQNPTTFDPYNVAGHEGLIARQHVVLDNMADQKMITKAEADAAKKVPILDSLKPLSAQYAGIKAPHFVQMVRGQLESELGKAVVGQGGLTITTTLDYRIQQNLEEAMNDMFSSYIPNYAGFTNGAATVEDNKTGQIVALLGSRDFNYEGFGQDNAAVASIQPGSTIKGFDYAQLFQPKPTGQANYGSGTILRDENIDAIYGAPLQNADRRFNGNTTIRQALATSRNIPAVKAMYISGVKPTIDMIHAMGGTSYCTQGTETQVGLSAAIGGCGIKQVDLVNAYASMARQGVYKPQASVLEVKNSSGEVIKKWTDDSKKIIDPQSAYIVADILNDDNARAPLDGHNALGMAIPGVKTATKTGTSDKGGFAKDIWMVSYSPVLTMGVWLGNSDTTILKRGTSSLPGSIIAKVMSYAHKSVYAPEGKWKLNDWFVQPVGIQRIGSELFPSWWSKSQGKSAIKMTFDKVSKKKATDCTPDGAKIELDVVKMVDAVTKKDVFIAPTGYDNTADDDVHKCTDAKPSVTVTATATGLITATASVGSFSIGSVSLLVDGQIVSTIAAPGPYTYKYTVPAGSAAKSVTAVVTDTGLYSATSAAATIPASN
ncbi:MAG: transglycosylase domain-containing protein [Candidatus Saccharibacteria bacterium]